MSFAEAIEGSLGTSGMPVGEDSVVVRLDDAGRKRKRGQDVLEKGFGDMDSHFFAELNEAGAGAALFRSSSTLGIQFFLKKESNRVTLASTWVPITSIQGDRSPKKIYSPSYLIQIYRLGIQI